MSALYTTTVVQNCINRFSEYEDPQIVQIEEGCLGMGDWILKAKGKKTVVIKEVFINEWSSGHSVRIYNKTPKKYEKYLC